MLANVTVDLRRKEWLVIPEITKLIEQHDGVIGDAERAAGVSIGYFSKVRSGKTAYTEEIRHRILAAINPTQTTLFNHGDQTDMNTKPIEIKTTCPPLLAELIRFKGGKSLAIKALGTSDGIFYSVINGKNRLPPAWEPRIKAILAGESAPAVFAAPAAHAAPAAPQVPAFVPWDGKLVAITLSPKAGQKKGRAVKVPGPFAALYEKHGILNAMAKSMGHTSGALTAMVNDPKKFTDKWQRKVHAALHGISLTPEAASDYDTYKLDLAIVMLKGGQNFDRVNELAEALGGILAWKKNTKDGWMLIYSMRAETAAKFKRLAARDASEIACP